jgi:hypothetical protein
MPTHDRIWPNDRRDLEDRREPTIQLDEKQAIAVRKLDTPPSPSAAARSTDAGAQHFLLQAQLST